MLKPWPACPGILAEMSHIVPPPPPPGRHVGSGPVTTSGSILASIAPNDEPAAAGLATPEPPFLPPPHTIHPYPTPKRPTK